MPTNTLVSVVIPTFQRPALVLQAVASAVRQTVNDLEIIVVIDGGDSETRAALESLSLPQLRLLPLEKQVGGSRARNEGVLIARGEWVAFLDDDDLWLPEKLERQLATARASNCSDPIVACKVVAQTPGGEVVWPRKLPSEPLSEYLLARDTWTQGEGLLQTSTLLVTRRLLNKVTFQDGLRKHQDWDWILRAVREPGVKIEFVDEPLAIWHLRDSGNGVSRKLYWQASLAWIRDRRELVTRRAYAGFIATQIASQAARQRQWKAFLPLLTEMCRIGRPKAIDMCLLLGMWFVPPSLRERLRSSW
jgi:glycosyltransferase involved in cell wall biosynthesis